MKYKIILKNRNGLKLITVQKATYTVLLTFMEGGPLLRMIKNLKWELFYSYYLFLFLVYYLKKQTTIFASWCCAQQNWIEPTAKAAKTHNDTRCFSRSDRVTTHWNVGKNEKFHHLKDKVSFEIHIVTELVLLLQLYTAQCIEYT